MPSLSDSMLLASRQSIKIPFYQTIEITCPKKFFATHNGQDFSKPGHRKPNQSTPVEATLSLFILIPNFLNGPKIMDVKAGMPYSDHLGKLLRLRFLVCSAFHRV